MMVGSIEAICSGQATVVEFFDDRILLRFESYRSARTIQRISLPDPRLLARGLNLVGRRLVAQIGQQGEIELFPNPNWWVKLISAPVRRLNKSKS